MAGQQRNLRTSLPLAFLPSLRRRWLVLWLSRFFRLCFSLESTLARIQATAKSGEGARSSALA